MDAKAKALLWIGVGMTVWATACFFRPIVGSDAAMLFGFPAGWAYWAFAFHPARRATMMVVLYALGFGGLSYYRYVRHDALGIAVAISAFAVAGGLAFWARRRLAGTP